MLVGPVRTLQATTFTVALLLVSLTAELEPGEKTVKVVAVVEMTV
jgi:hypothetical protein